MVDRYLEICIQNFKQNYLENKTMGLKSFCLEITEFKTMFDLTL